MYASFALLPLPVAGLGDGLVDTPPQRPAEEMIEHYACRALEPADETADLARAEVDQRSRLGRPLLRGAAMLSLVRMPARKARASMARMMCRYQPCQERIS